MRKRVAIMHTIAHWRRMIDWAKGQKRSDLAGQTYMEASMQQGWNASNCMLCKKYRIHIDIGLGCLWCPLKRAYGNCGKNAWAKVRDAKTWHDWVIAGEDMLTQLISLL